MKKGMISIVAALLLLFSCHNPTTETDADDNNLSDTLLLTDFEAGSGLDTLFLTYNDSTHGGLSQITFTISSDNGNSVGVLDYTLNKGDFPYYPEVYVEFYPDGNYYGTMTNFTNYEGLKYRYKGSKHSLMVPTKDIVDAVWYRVALPATSEWNTVEISFSKDLTQPNWGVDAPFTQVLATSINWFIYGNSGETGTLLIDDIYLLKECEGLNSQ